MSDTSTPAHDGETSGAFKTHLLVYGKLIRGGSQDGPIRLGTEHRVTGKSAEFPDGLQQHCAPETFFKGWGGVTAVDAGLIDGGAFVYRPLRLRLGTETKFFGLFARIEARSEGGKGKPGRRYTHCAVLAVEDEWRPEMIPIAASFLFEHLPDGRCYGSPNAERDQDRLAMELPRIVEEDLPGLPEPPGLNWRAESVEDMASPFTMRHYCQSRLHQTDIVAESLAIAAYLQTNELSQAGRWLSFGLGVRSSAIGVADGFALIGDDREGEGQDSIVLRFSDQWPPSLPASGGRLEDWKSLVYRPPPKQIVEAPAMAIAAAAGAGWGEESLADPAPGESASDIAAPGVDLVRDRPTPNDAPQMAYQRSNGPNPLTPHTYNFNYFDKDIEERVKKYDLNDLKSARDLFRYKLHGVSERNIKYMETDDDKKIIYELDNFLKFVFRYSLKKDPAYFECDVLDAFELPSLPKLGLKEARNGSLLTVYFNSVVTVYREMDPGNNIFSTNFSDFHEKHRKHNQNLGMTGSTERPLELRFFDFLEHICKYPHRDGGFYPNRDKIHAQVQGDLNRIAKKLVPAYFNHFDRPQPDENLSHQEAVAIATGYIA